jgi:hypothetical protein
VGAHVLAPDRRSDQLHVSEMFENYMNEEHPDVDEDSPEWFEFQSDFFDDEKLFKSELVKYIDNTY